MTDTVLIVDDDRAFRIATAALLEDQGLAVQAVENAVRAKEVLTETRIDLVLSDVVMEGMNGLHLLKWISEHVPGTPVMMVTGYASIQTAVEAMRLGAFDYVIKPSDNDELVIKIRRALDIRRRERELRQLHEELETTYNFGSIISQNARMRDTFRMMSQVAETDVTVLVLGETGTGKELVARAVHYNSMRKTKPFIVVNCAAIPESLLESELFGHEKNAFTGAVRQRIGKFEDAHEGTVFLDEIGDVPYHVQTKLLRVLQEREIQRVGSNTSIPVDVRVVAATNRNLEAMIAEGTFRADLYYRLNEFPIVLPPLRERPEDIPVLAQHFIEKHSQLAAGRVRGISPEALASMLRYEWKGNVRELENIIKRSLVTAQGDSIERIDLPAIQGDMTPGGSYPVPENSEIRFRDYIKTLVETAESSWLRTMLTKHAGNVSAVAALMEVDRKTIYRKLEEYGIEIQHFR